MRPKIWNLELFGMITLRHLYFSCAYLAGLVIIMQDLKYIFYGKKENHNKGYSRSLFVDLIRAKYSGFHP